VQARDEAVADYRNVLDMAADRWYVRLQLAKLLLEMTRYAEASPNWKS
jgi:hypothetical protein